MPTVLTLPASTVGPPWATFNSRVDPDRSETRLSYRYGLGNAFNLTTAELTIRAGHRDRAGRHFGERADKASRIQGPHRRDQ
jgi:hypothetical protein